MMQNSFTKRFSINEQKIINARVAKLKNLLVYKQKIYILKAPTGWGKSVLLRAFEEDTKNSAYFSSDVNLLPGSILENIYLGRDIQIDQFEFLFEDLSIRMTDYYEDLSNILSRGQSQRVRLVRALTSNAKILLFDEILSGLDSKTFIKCYEYLKKVVDERNKIVVLVHHGIETFQLDEEVICFTN